MVSEVQKKNLFFLFKKTQEIFIWLPFVFDELWKLFSTYSVLCFSSNEETGERKKKKLSFQMRDFQVNRIKFVL